MHVSLNCPSRFTPHTLLHPAVCVGRYHVSPHQRAPQQALPTSCPNSTHLAHFSSAQNSNCQYLHLRV